jgi:hypothetical protein
VAYTGGLGQSEVSGTSRVARDGQPKVPAVEHLPAGDFVPLADASAFTEFERRKQRHEEWVARYRRRLLAAVLAGVLVGLGVMLVSQLLGLLVILIVLGVAVKITAPLNRTQAWATGAKAEDLTLLALEQLRAERFIVLDDRRVPGCAATVGHIVIGPPGIAIVAIKSHGDALTSRTVEAARLEASAVTTALADVLEGLGLKVRPVICVHRASLATFAAARYRVAVVDGRGLVRLFRKSPARLSARDARELARVAHDRFRPAVTPVPELYGQLPTTSPNHAPAIAEPLSWPYAADRDERFMPPVRRSHIQIAREARAAATDRRVYWSQHGSIPGKAPSTIPPNEPKQS